MVVVAAVLITMAFSVQKWGKLFHWREEEGSRVKYGDQSQQSAGTGTALVAASNPRTRRRLKRGTTGLGLRTSGLSLRDLRDALGGR